MSKKQMKKTKITADTLIDDVVSKHPETAEIMMKCGMHCIGCMASSHETVEQGALAHGMNKQQIKKMLEEMNRTAKL